MIFISKSACVNCGSDRNVTQLVRLGRNVDGLTIVRSICDSCAEQRKKMGEEERKTDTARLLAKVVLPIVPRLSPFDDDPQCGVSGIMWIDHDCKRYYYSLGGIADCARTAIELWGKQLFNVAVLVNSNEPPRIPKWIFLEVDRVLDFYQPADSVVPDYAEILTKIGMLPCELS